MDMHRKCIRKERQTKALPQRQKYEDSNMQRNAQEMRRKRAENTAPAGCGTCLQTATISRMFGYCECYDCTHSAKRHDLGSLGCARACSGCVLGAPEVRLWRASGDISGISRLMYGQTGVEGIAKRRALQLAMRLLSGQVRH